MSDKDQPVSQLKQQQRIDWNAAAAGWKRWGSAFERAAQHVSDRLVELAAVRPGHRVADLATGIGDPAITPVCSVGAAGRVVAIDQSPGMLAVAGERAASLSLGNLEFRVGDIESLEADEHTFDAALCRWG